MIRETFTLSRPTQAHGEEIDTLRLREPNAGDIAATGEPFTITNLDELAAAEAGGGGSSMPKFAWNMAATVALISRLADVPRSTVASISQGDLFKLQMVLVGFFLRQFGTETGVGSSSPATGSPPASISPGSGDAIPPVSLRSVGTS